jgi:hypothetical protein
MGNEFRPVYHDGIAYTVFGFLQSTFEDLSLTFYQESGGLVFWIVHHYSGASVPGQYSA